MFSLIYYYRSSETQGPFVGGEPRFFPLSCPWISEDDYRMYINITQSYSIREFKLHVYGKRQTSNSSWEFLKIENEKMKTAQKILMDEKNCVKLLIYV